MIRIAADNTFRAGIHRAEVLDRVLKILKFRIDRLVQNFLAEDDRSKRVSNQLGRSIGGLSPLQFANYIMAVCKADYRDKAVNLA